MDQNELRAILNKHNLWVKGLSGGERANLSGANLYGANLTRANLTRANLTRADLTRANLSGANLYGANLTRADLTRANLTRADLTRADLTRANLFGANFSNTDLARVLMQKSIVPEQGPFWAYKAVRCVDTGRVVILQLEIPATAQRIGGMVGRKCRVSEAIVLNATLPDGTPFEGDMCSAWDRAFTYRVGQHVTPGTFDPNPLVECSSGINILITRLEAVAYFDEAAADALIAAAHPDEVKTDG